MEKKTSSSDQTSEMDVDCEGDEEEAVVEWQISAIVKKKVVFAKRPMPLLHRPVSKVGNQ